LQALQAAITQSPSWDRTIEDVERELRGGVFSGDFARVQRVAVLFQCAGVAVCSRLDGELRLERLLYHPEELPGAFEARRPGAILGATSLLTAALARHTLEPASYPLFVAAGRGLAAIRDAHDNGGGRVQGRDATALLASFTGGKDGSARLYHPPAELPTNALPEASFRAAFPRRALGEPEPTAPCSDLVQDVTGPGYEFVLALAMQVVLRGVAMTLDSVPQAHYGAYLTVDREEIEHVNEVRRLIAGYRVAASDRRPLALAVFGPPGSGKSFAIKQVAAELFGRAQAVLEFNLSQLGSREELHAAFDQVRDATVRGQIPLVFWDEFDSGQLVWLKEFLAPVQDAEYRAGSVVHPFGKVIFVFAGGTCTTFQEFDRSAVAGATGEQFRLAKGPDFVSRLRGYVNIKGPNPWLTPGQTTALPPAEADVAHLIRRAILLRSVVERAQPQLIEASGRAAIGAGVLRGFLRTEQFRHGARSLEAIVGMSDLSGARHYGVAELPSPDLLGLHASADFIRWVQESELEEATIELLAEATHRAWQQSREAAGWTYATLRDDERRAHPLLVAYERLPEGDRERNRHTARVTLAKLRQIGYRVERVPPSLQSGPASLPATRLSASERRRLIEIEHGLWLRDRLLHGYAYAEHTIERLRLQRDLTTLEDLPPEDLQLDEALVDAALAALHGGGYRLAPVTEERTRVRVGVTGHRLLAETARVSAGLREALARIRSAYGNRPLTLLSMLAEGADRLAVEAALHTPDAEHVAMLPLAPEEYAHDFGPPGSPSRVHFAALLARSTAVLQVGAVDGREAGYARAGQELVNRCDVLLAVWDGEAARGAGGTAENVARARAQGKPVVVVRAGNHDASTQVPTTLGEEQGVIVAEGLPATSP
jgi:hypothetical protein